MALRTNKYRDAQNQRAAELLGQADALQEIEVTAQKIVLHEETKKETDKKDGTEPSQELQEITRKYRYPLTIGKNYPAHIVFRAIKVEGADFREAVGDVATGLGNIAKRISPAIAAGSYLYDRATRDSQDVSEADKEISEEEKAGIKSGLNKFGSALKSYENLEGGEIVGEVMMPLQQSLTFQDGVIYNEANLGISGSALGAVTQGKNPFEGIMGANGQLSRAAAGIAAETVAKNAASLAGAAVGSQAGTVGAAFGFGALGGVGEGVGAAIKNASRVTTNPNQRTLFEKVRMREFNFTFKMIANNSKEAQEVRNIVKFFREEVYPESIVVNEVPLAYEFPNIFEIEIKNHLDDTPSPKIQRCYLESIQTVYNATANSMHTDGNFVEVDVTLNFKEIVAMDKKKVRDGGY